MVTHVLDNSNLSGEMDGDSPQGVHLQCKAQEQVEKQIPSMIILMKFQSSVPGAQSCDFG